jgi:predicted hydrocarbon binding protein
VIAVRKISVDVTDDGKIVYLGDEVVLSSAGVFAFLQQAIAAEDPVLASRVMYQSGEEFSREAVSGAQKLFIRTVGSGMKRTLVGNMMNLGLERGFGVFAAEDSYNYATGAGLVSVTHSVIARFVKKSPQPVCFHIAGIISGAAQILYDSDFVCHEVLCAAQGGPKCVFSLQRVSKAAKKDFYKTMKPY